MVCAGSQPIYSRSSRSNMAARLQICQILDPTLHPDFSWKDITDMEITQYLTYTSDGPLFVISFRLLEYRIKMLHRKIQLQKQKFRPLFVCCIDFTTKFVVIGSMDRKSANSRPIIALESCDVTPRERSVEPGGLQRKLLQTLFRTI